MIAFSSSYRTPIFKWYVVRCGCKNKHQKYTCLKEIGLRAENIAIMETITNIISGHVHGDYICMSIEMSLIIFTFYNE